MLPCVLFTAGPSTKLFAWGRTCATRDDEPRPVWTSLPSCSRGITAVQNCAGMPSYLHTTVIRGIPAADRRQTTCDVCGAGVSWRGQAWRSAGKLLALNSLHAIGYIIK